MELALFAAIVFVASLVNGVIGFANALVAVPLALLFLSKETVVSSMVVVGLALNGFLTVRIRESFSSRLVALLFVASLAGMPVGVWMLTAIPINALKVFVGCLVVLFTVLLQWGRFKLPQNSLLTATAGFFSGLLNTSTTMAGPPVLILLAGQELAKDPFRRTLASFFLVSGLVAALTLVVTGVMTPERASYGVVAIPFVFLGGFVGDRISARLPERPFRVLALAVLFVAGVYSVVTGLV
jgi:uncharacterized membrane protein YfcA